MRRLRRGEASGGARGGGGDHDDGSSSKIHGKRERGIRPGFAGDAVVVLAAAVFPMKTGWLHGCMQSRLSPARGRHCTGNEISCRDEGPKWRVILNFAENLIELKMVCTRRGGRCMQRAIAAS